MRAFKERILFLSGVAVSVFLSIIYLRVLRTLTPSFAVNDGNISNLRYTGKTKVFSLLLLV